MKQEQLVLTMTKLILVISLIVGIGIMLKTQEYIMTNSETLIQPTQAQTSQIQEETLNKADIGHWKIYRHEGYGFEVKYPGNWVSKNEYKKRTFLAGVDLEDYTTESNYLTSPVFLVKVFKGGEYTEEQVEDHVNLRKFILTKEEKIIVSGIDAIQLTYNITEVPMNIMHRIKIPFKNKMYFLEFNYTKCRTISDCQESNEESTENYEKVWTRIISSFNIFEKKEKEPLENVPISFQEATMNIINFIFGFGAIISILMVSYGVLKFAIAIIKEEKEKEHKAQKVIICGVVILIICFLAYAFTFPTPAPPL